MNQSYAQEELTPIFSPFASEGGDVIIEAGDVLEWGDIGEDIFGQEVGGVSKKKSQSKNVAKPVSRAISMPFIAVQNGFIETSPLGGAGQKLQTSQLRWSVDKMRLETPHAPILTTAAANAAGVANLTIDSADLDGLNQAYFPWVLLQITNPPLQSSPSSLITVNVTDLSSERVGAISHIVNIRVRFADLNKPMIIAIVPWILVQSIAHPVMGFIDASHPLSIEVAGLTPSMGQVTMVEPGSRHKTTINF